MMEIEEFVEQDIMQFLDDRLDKAKSTLSVRQRAPIQSNIITRDYEYEFFMMLDRKDLDGAKRILHDLKAKFDECPNNIPEKLQLKALLLDLYEKFKDHLDVQNKFSSIDSQLSGAPTPNPQAREPAAPSQDAPPPLPAMAAPKAEPASATPQDEQHITACLDIAEQDLRDGKVKDAALAYRDAKRMILNAPSVSDTVVRRCVDVYNAIHGRMTVAAPTPQATRPDAQAVRAATTPAAARADGDREILLALEQEKNELDRHISRNDVLSAMRSYRTMRLLAQQLRDASNVQEVGGKMQALYTLITEMKRHIEAPGKTLAGPRP